MSKVARPLPSVGAYHTAPILLRDTVFTDDSSSTNSCHTFHWRHFHATIVWRTDKNLWAVCSTSRLCTLWASKVAGSLVGCCCMLSCCWMLLDVAGYVAGWGRFAPNRQEVQNLRKSWSPSIVDKTNCQMLWYHVARIYKATP